MRTSNLVSLFAVACGALTTVFGADKEKGGTTAAPSPSPGPQIYFDLENLSGSGFQRPSPPDGDKQADQNERNRLAMVWVKSLGCYVAKYEVTQAEYSAVMGRNPSEFKGDRRPVENVSWKDASEFCKKLTAKARNAGALPAGWEFLLPTEMQWETFVADANLNDAITSKEGRRSATENVGTRRPNGHGLYDVLGNVWEWCKVPPESNQKNQVVRGASWYSSEPSRLEAGYRAISRVSIRDFNIGFRCIAARASQPDEAQPGQLPK